MLVRDWKGKSHRVTVLARGFEYEDRNFESLSEIARNITGTRWNGPRFFGLRGRGKTGGDMMKREKLLRCAIYTRKSTEHGLELEFNSLDAQREACEAYIKSQTHEGWSALADRYDDPAFSGGNLDRPALQKLLTILTLATLTSLLFIKSIGSPARSLILPSWSKRFDQEGDFVCRRDAAV